jgi:hypothetical protein
MKMKPQRRKDTKMHKAFVLLSVLVTWWLSKNEKLKGITGHKRITDASVSMPIFIVGMRRNEVS